MRESIQYPTASQENNMAKQMRTSIMKGTFKSILSAVVALGFVASQIAAVQACTMLAINDEQGNVYKGRTLEFSGVFPSSLSYLPAGTHVESETPDGKQGMTFDTKYNILGMLAPIVPGSKQQTILDGMNDQGLTITLNGQNFTQAPAITTTDPSKILSAGDIAHWLLGNFKTVDEVKAALAGDTEFWLPKLPLFGDIPFPVHFAILDKAGGSIVLEFMNGKKNVYDNPVNALTNGPEFPWHLTNLINYTPSNIDQNTAQFGKLKVATPDSGIAASILPSSQTAVGRFVRAAFYVNYVKKATTPDEAVATLGHIINNFDRPTNLTVDDDSDAGRIGDGVAGKGFSSEVTDYTVMADLSRNLYYVRSIQALNWTVVDINKLKGVTTRKDLSAYEVYKVGTDATDFFRN